MKLHHELLNFIAKKISAGHYLEIGVHNPEHNFNLIDVKHKVSVDPDPKAGATMCMTSDDFFEWNQAQWKKDKENPAGVLFHFDLVFVDGLHHADQVKKDIQHAWEYLFPGGVMVVHDSKPPSKATTCVPRGSQREWCGDVYRTVCQIMSPGFFTMDFDYGCCVIRKTGDPLLFHDAEVTWEHFEKASEFLIHLVSVEKGLEIIESWT